MGSTGVSTPLMAVGVEGLKAPRVCAGLLGWSLDRLSDYGRLVNSTQSVQIDTHKRLSQCVYFVPMKLGLYTLQLHPHCLDLGGKTCKAGLGCHIGFVPVD